MKKEKSRIILIVISFLLLMNIVIFLILNIYNKNHINHLLKYESAIFKSVWNTNLSNSFAELHTIKDYILENENLSNLINNAFNAKEKEELTLFFHHNKTAYNNLSSIIIIRNEQLIFSSGKEKTAEKFLKQPDLFKSETQLIHFENKSLYLYHISLLPLPEGKNSYLILEYNFNIQEINNSFSTTHKFYQPQSKDIENITSVISTKNHDNMNFLSLPDNLNRLQIPIINNSWISKIALFNIYPVKNIFNKKESLLVFYKDISAYINIQNDYLFFLIISNTFFIFIASIFLFRTFNKYAHRIDDLNLNLKKKVHDQNIELSHKNIELTQIFNSAASALHVVDLEGKIIKCNKKFIELTGQKEKYILGKKCSEIFTISECPLKYLLSHRNENSVTYKEQRNIQGKDKIFRITSSLIKDKNENVIGMITEYSDVSDMTAMRQEIDDNQKILKTITDTSLTCLILANNSDNKIIYVNPLVETLTGQSLNELTGISWHSLFNYQKNKKLKQFLFDNSFNIDNLTTDVFLRRKNNPQIKVRLAIQKIIEKDKVVLSFQDINDITNILEKQKINTNKAKRLHSLISPNKERYIPISEKMGNIYFEIFSSNCHAAGGDHCFIKNIHTDPSNPLKQATFFSINDQSGHEVNCILRSITTDFLYKSIIEGNHKISFTDTIKYLNATLIESGLFDSDEFLTSTLGFIDHSSMKLEIINCAHPPMLLIRNNEVNILPHKDISRNIPLGSIKDFSFNSFSISLKPKDKLIFLTDGLLEMPISMQGEKILIKQVKGILESIISNNQYLNIKEIIALLIKCISSFSGIKIYNNGFNNSADDVSILGIEIEKPIKTLKILTPEQLKDLTFTINTLTEDILQDWETYSFTDDFSLHLALEESIMNALHHGNKSVNHPLTIRWWAENQLHIEVEDQGDGFDPSAVSDPTIPLNIMKDAGRGIFIMKKVSDKINWLNNGKTIHIIFDTIPRPQLLEKTNLNLWK